MKFYITDVFGNKKYSGNQLATFLDYGTLSSHEMQQIAREINFSETTFITSQVAGKNGFPVRIFTPGNEIDFAGHPTLGTAYIIQKYIELPGIEKISLDLPVGHIPVTIENNHFWMAQNQPEFGREIPVGEISALIGIDQSDFIPDHPVLETTTGLPFTIIPLKSLEAVKKAEVDLQEYAGFINKTWAKGILVFSPEAYEKDQDLSVRVFVNYLGIPEDPATGSAAGCLSAYLLKTRFFGNNKLELKVGQGYEIGRPSEIRINAGIFDERYEIKVGGKVFEIASGNWNTSNR